MSIKVLIVEDSDVVRNRLMRAIESVPNVKVVGECEEAGAAIHAVQQQRPDVLLLDISLRNSSGIDVLKAVASDHPEMKIVVLTNYTEPQYRDACLQHGAHYFLDKSVEFEKVPWLLAQMTTRS